MEGWTLAVCEYHKITIQLKHQNLSSAHSEALLCPIFHDSPLPDYFQSLNQSMNIVESSKYLQLKENTVRDFSCPNLPACRLVCAKLPQKASFDQFVRIVKVGLEVCGSLGCSSVSLAFSNVGPTLEKSAELCLESVELYVLGQIDNPGCVKVVSVCCFSPEELAALNEASRFRMTRYSSFVCIGMPEDLNEGQMYCYKCFSIFPAGHEDSHC